MSLTFWGLIKILWSGLLLLSPVLHQSGVWVGAWNQRIWSPARSAVQPTAVHQMASNESSDSAGIDPAPKLRIGATDLKIAGLAGAAIDARSDAILFDYRADEIRPIASISKLMTALVFLDHNPGWDNVYQVSSDDHRDGGKVSVFAGDKVKLRHLFAAMLVASDNSAVVALVRSTGLSLPSFVDQMNQKAEALGLVNTEFYDPTGLDQRNVSTALEVARLARAAWQRPEIQEIALLEDYSFATEQGDERRVFNTDNLLADRGGEIRIQGGKTGYLTTAGYCFVGQFSKDGKQIITAVLGSPTKESRFTETSRITQWVYNNYRWFK